MKKLFCLMLTAVFAVSCRSQPAEYTYYENFVPEKMGVEITPVSVEKYNDITDESLNSLLESKLGLENLIKHSIYTTRSKAVAEFYLSSDAGHEEVEKLLEYAYETLWTGKMHTADLLPYEDWQYSHRIKDLTVQIYCEDIPVVQETYSFDKLTDSGEKLYEKTRVVNNDVLLTGTYIYLGDWLKGDDAQLAAYTDIEKVAGITVHTALRQTLDKDRLIAELLTEERQIDPQKLNRVYDAVYERYSFISENIIIRLYVADKGMYFEYTGHIQLPQE